MKLTEKSKVDIRKYIEENIKEIPDGERIHLDKTFLEELLFYDVYVPCPEKNERQKVRILVWSGDFLQKIDLSEVSFDNVLWSFEKIGKLSSQVHSKYFKEFFEIMTNSVNHNEYTIDLAHTNAKINFETASFFNFNEKGLMDLRFCNFEGLDLRDANLQKIGYAKKCNFSNCMIDIGQLISNGRFGDCNFNFCHGWECDFNIDYSTFINLFRNCSFKDSGLNIKIEEKIQNHDFKNLFISSYKKGYYDGCYFNGKLKKTRQECEDRKKEIRKNYEEFIKGNLDSVERQVSLAKKRQKK